MYFFQKIWAISKKQKSHKVHHRKAVRFLVPLFLLKKNFFILFYLLFSVPLPPLLLLSLNFPYSTPNLFLRESETSHLESTKAVITLDAGPRTSSLYLGWARCPFIVNVLQKANLCTRGKYRIHHWWPKVTEYYNLWHSGRWVNCSSHNTESSAFKYSRSEYVCWCPQSY